MTRRILTAVAALVMLTFASMVWTQPAQAAPNTGPCSLEEWRNPASFADCAKRTQQAVQNQTGCVTAPTPGSPTAGMAGSFTSRPDSSLRSGVGGQYSMYGVGGYGLDTYDMGCLGSIKHPDLVAWNTVASAQFGMAASIVGASNGLRELAYNPGSMWGWSDGFVGSATTTIYTYVFNPFGGVMLALVGLFLLWRARHGEMSQAMKMTAWAVFVMVAVTGVAKWPVTAAHGFDKGATATLSVVHSVLGPGKQDVPADKCVLGGEACKDNRSVSTRAADVVADAVLYRAWLRAMLGSADSPTAKKYGPALFDATTLSWGEAERAEQSPELRKQLIEQKAATFNTVAQQINAEDPLAYEYLQGLHGLDRAGSGALAVLSAIAFAAFDMMASLVILFAFLVFRIAIIALPLVGTAGIFMPASNAVHRVFHMVGAAFMNIAVFGAAAGIYLGAVNLIYKAALPGAAQLAATAMIGVGLLLLLHPIRHLTHTVTGRSRADDGLIVRAFKAGKTIQSRPQPGPAEQIEGAETGASGPRPEAAPSRTRTIVTAVAPSIAGVTSNPYVTAATDAFTAGQRPEATRTDRVKAAAGAVAAVAASAAAGPAAGAAVTATTTSASTRPRAARPETRS